MPILVFVVDIDHRPLSPCHPARARRLLTQGKAAVWRHAPFTLILKRRVPEATPAPVRLKLDPGSQTTGLAVVHDASGQVVWAAELTHRGAQIRAALLARKAARRGRRQRHTRYRPARFANRRRLQGWLPPSLTSRVAHVLTWVARLRRVCPIGALALELELVRFDTQLLQSAEISGVEYQHGELAGFEVREYLLEKWGRECSYCHKSGVPLEIEHIVPKKGRGGTDRVSNLALACRPCNQAKGNRTAAEFGHPGVQATAQQPLRDAAAANATRWALFCRLHALGVPLETGTGGRTKWNRTVCGLPKTHWLDAACVGASTPPVLHTEGVVPLLIRATGHGTRQQCGTNRAGFPIRHRTRQKRHFGFATGDQVRVVVPVGLRTAGKHVGRALVRASGSFDLTTGARRLQGINHRYFHLVAYGDGYADDYANAHAPAEGAGAWRSGASSPA